MFWSIFFPSPGPGSLPEVALALIDFFNWNKFSIFLLLPPVKIIGFGEGQFIWLTTFLPALMEGQGKVGPWGQDRDNNRFWGLTAQNEFSSASARWQTFKNGPAIIYCFVIGILLVRPCVCHECVPLCSFLVDRGLYPFYLLLYPRYLKWGTVYRKRLRIFVEWENFWDHGEAVGRVSNQFRMCHFESDFALLFITVNNLSQPAHQTSAIRSTNHS